MSKILKLFMMLLLTAACSPKDNREELTITDSDGNKNVYKVELAQTKEELSTGLMNRTALDADSGMVFDLSDFNNVPTAMWMKDTKIALDMLFIDRDGMIYWIFENAEPDSVKMIVAPYPATAVLEINAGDVKAKGIEIGDMVEYKLFPVEKAAADANEVADEGQDEDDTPVETVVEEDKAEIEETVAEDEKAAAENAAPSEKNRSKQPKKKLKKPLTLKRPKRKRRPKNKINSVFQRFSPRTFVFGEFF